MAPKHPKHHSTILIVDDTPKNIELLMGFLEPVGYKLAFAGSGEAALELVPRLVPDLILLDVKMTGIDGFETCRRLKNNETLQPIPVIFVTAMTDEQQLAEGFASGGVDYITKPVKRSEVLARVETQLNLQTLIRFQQGVIDTLENQLDDTTSEFERLGYDLRSPLGAIVGYSEILREDAEQHGLDEFVQGQTAIVAACNQIKQQLNNLLMLAKLEANRLPLYYEECTINTLLKWTQHQISNQVPSKSMTIKALGDDVVAHLDAEKTQRILTLLTGYVVNKLNGDHVELSWSKGGGLVAFHVSYEGLALGEKTAQQLREMTKIPTHSDIGLKLCIKLAEMMDAQVNVTDRDGGSIFTVQLPDRSDGDKQQVA